MERFIKLSTIKEITELHQLAAASKAGPDEIAVKKGRWTIDPRSLMGLFSIDCSTGCYVEYPNDETKLDKFCSLYEAAPSE